MQRVYTRLFPEKFCKGNFVKFDDEFKSFREKLKCHRESKRTGSFALGPFFLLVILLPVRV